MRSACPQPARVGTRVRAGRCGAETRSEPLVAPGVIDGCTRSGRAPESRRDDAGQTWMVYPLVTALHSTVTRRPDGRPVGWCPVSKLHPVRTALARAEATASPPAVAPFKPRLQAYVCRAARRDRQPGLFPHSVAPSLRTRPRPRGAARASAVRSAQPPGTGCSPAPALRLRKGAPLGNGATSRQLHFSLSSRRSASLQGAHSVQRVPEWGLWRGAS